VEGRKAWFLQPFSRTWLEFWKWLVLIRKVKGELGLPEAFEGRVVRGVFKGSGSLGDGFGFS